jgi:excisionase family DNA binding protein
MSHTTPGQLPTVTEAAERLDTQVRFVRRLIAERRTPFHKIGRHVRIHTRDIDDFIAASRVESVVARRRPR